MSTTKAVKLRKRNLQGGKTAIDVSRYRREDSHRLHSMLKGEKNMKLILRGNQWSTPQLDLLGKDIGDSINFDTVKFTAFKMYGIDETIKLVIAQILSKSGIEVLQVVKSKPSFSRMVLCLSLRNLSSLKIFKLASLGEMGIQARRILRCVLVTLRAESLHLGGGFDLKDLFGAFSASGGMEENMKKVQTLGVNVTRVTNVIGNLLGFVKVFTASMVRQNKKMFRVPSRRAMLAVMEKLPQIDDKTYLGCYEAYEREFTVLPETSIPQFKAAKINIVVNDLSNPQRARRYVVNIRENARIQDLHGEFNLVSGHRKQRAFSFYVRNSRTKCLRTETLVKHNLHHNSHVDYKRNM